MNNMEPSINKSFYFNNLDYCCVSGENNFFSDFTDDNFFDLKDDSLIKDRTYKCPICFQYPIIHYSNNIDIEVTCSCYNKKRMTIDEFLNPKEKSFKNNLLSFSLDREDSFYEKNDIDNKSKNKCTIHQKKFKYYWNDCEINLCKDCFKNHKFHKIHNFTKYIRDNESVIKQIKAKLLSCLLKYLNKSISSFLSYESEEEKQTLKDKYIKLFKTDNNNLIKISGKKLKNFYIFSNLIIDEALNNPNIIHCYNIQNLLEFLKKNEQNFDIKINLIDKNKIIDPNIESYYKESQDKLFDEILSKF